ncbi:hypothetical protein AGLY_008221 [Aphis glycines]|uniref:Uncharacterized protein n=1 Tax=Aphis glycines TaxID=307491 RepID=A0A6G0TLA4_APHGL|nr:hypothetical protein AGLY_008221 [Aphis glycines]
MNIKIMTLKQLRLRDSGCPFLTDKGQLRVQVEWEESYLLFQATYHKYDDVSRTHNYQMRRTPTVVDIYMCVFVNNTTEGFFAQNRLISIKPQVTNTIEYHLTNPNQEIYYGLIEDNLNPIIVYNNYLIRKPNGNIILIKYNYRKLNFYCIDCLLFKIRAQLIIVNGSKYFLSNIINGQKIIILSSVLNIFYCTRNILINRPKNKFHKLKGNLAQNLSARKIKLKNSKNIKRKKERMKKTKKNQVDEKFTEQRLLDKKTFKNTPSMKTIL